MIAPYSRFSPTRPACATADGSVRYSEHDVSMLLVTARELPAFLSAETIAEGYCKRDRLTLSAGTLWVFAQRLSERRSKASAAPRLTTIAPTINE